LGWDVYVTDVSEYAVLETRKHFELNGFVSSPVKLPVKAERFDLITLYDVVENLSHPLDLLKDIRKALHTDGVLHIVTPNSQSISAKIMGRKWSHLKPSEHFLYFTPETLRSALERVGFDVLKIKNISNYIRVNDLLLKFEKLSKPLVSGLRKFAKFLGIADMRIKIYTGQMQVWARPVNLGRSSKFVPVKDILDIVCCSHCKSELQLFEDSEAICTECELSFDVSHGVINFSKYGKRYKQKVV
jgi:SAM-dependent methyltransferase